MSVTVEKAIELILKDASLLDCETVPVLYAVGRVLASDVRASIDQPPFPRSPLDGYAVRSEDTVGASATTPRQLRVTSRIFAGMDAVTPVREGEAARIMTGAMLPRGADCVVRQEDTDGGEETVNIFVSHRQHENYVFAGEDFRKGDLLAKAGIRLDAAALSVAAATGLTCIRVRRRPRVSVVSTGDELVEPGNALPSGKIYNSNQTYMCTRLIELGAEIVSAASAGDELALICSALSRAAEISDLIITTGGVSVGQKDLLPEALSELGADVVFHGVAMKPGMPTLFARLKNVPVLALSGNPFAAAVALELFARPLLHKLTGDPGLTTVRRTAALGSEFGKKSSGRRFVRGRFEAGFVTLPEGHSNGQMGSMVGCNCLVDIPAGTGTLKKGDEIEVLIL
ncbi:MAG: gephyrin-like molybdotransferase Glp [Oscillospiraceae bacterium]|jgi:molybdopterin molybdotransferase